MFCSNCVRTEKELTESKDKKAVEKHMKKFRASLGAQSLSVEDMAQAEKSIVRCSQWQSFAQEIADLEEDGHVKTNSTIFRLDPILQDGLLRVGGRLRRAAMPEDIKHPVILGKGSHLSTLILRNIHIQIGHSGWNHMLSKLRQRYWIVDHNSATKIIFKEMTSTRAVYQLTFHHLHMWALWTD